MNARMNDNTEEEVARLRFIFLDSCKQQHDNKQFRDFV